MGKKKEILNAASILFSIKGYNLSMSEISKAVNIKTPSLYSHFESKEEIVEQIVKEEIEECFYNFQKKMQLMNDKTCKEKFEGALFVIFNYFNQYGKLAFWRNIPLMQNDKLRNQFQSFIEEKEYFYVKKLKDCFQKAIEDGEIKETVGDGAVYLYFAMIQGILDGLHLHQNSLMDFNDYIGKTWEAYWEGIKVIEEKEEEQMVKVD